MGFRDIQQRLKKAAWTARVVARTMYESGCLKELTWSGVRVGLQGLRQRRLGPVGAVAIHAANHPHREAIIDRYRRLTYQEMVEEATRIGDALRKRGLKPDEPVGIMLRNRAEFVTVENGVTRAGAALVHLSYRLKTEEAAYILENSGARMLFFEADLAPIARALREKLPQLTLCVSIDPIEGFPCYEDLLKEGDPNAAPPQDAPNDSALVIYTSGTTGKPKGASRRIGSSSIGPTMAFLHAMGLKSEDRHLAVCPLYHSAGLGFAVFTFSLGGTVVMMDHFDPEEVLRTIEREKITTAMMVPTMYQRLVDLPEEIFRKYDTSSIRRLVSGAAILPVPLQEAVVKRFGPVLCDFYGSTETGWNTLALPEDLAKKPGTIGRPIDGNEIRLLDEDGREVGVGEIGQIYVRSDMLIDGYHRNEDATRASMRDGFFSVGDLAYRDADGYYFLAGRKHDMVITGGVNVYPKEIEDCLHRHPAVVDVAVVGVVHSQWGEMLRAFVVRREGEGLQEEDLKRFCKEHLADFKCPKEFYFVPEIPRNPTGKILKKDLRQWDPSTPWPWQAGAGD